jgi:hypothetical protein
MKARAVLLAGMLALAASAYPQADPAATGSHAVASQDYTQGDTVFTPAGFPAPIEFTGVVFYPTDLAAGPYPLVLYLHGRHATCGTGTLEWPCTGGRTAIQSYHGYDYSAQQLASQGYVVVSISANGINAMDNSTADLGAAARAELIDRHLEYWRTLDTAGAAPFGALFVGHVDLTRVGTMGHSRGGEGVMRHVSYNAGKAQPFPLKVIVPIAPTNFSRWQVNQNLAVSQFLPYCDGDVSNLQGVHYYDDARYLMTGTGHQSYVTVMGANHNYFNTVWTPGMGPGAADDWGTPADPFCGTVAGNGRLSSAQQRAVGLAYLAAFFRTEVGGEPGFFGYVDGTAGKPPTVTALSLFTSYQGNDSERRDLNRLLATADLGTNFLGGAVSQSGLSPHDLCGGLAPQPQHCLTGQSTARMPHTAPSTLSGLRGLSSLRTGWSAAGARFTNQIPAGPLRNLTPFNYLQFRATLDYTDGRNAAGAAQDLSVRLTDSGGNSRTVRVGQASDALFFPPGTMSAVPKILENTVRVPLVGFAGIDLTAVATVDMLFDQRASGALLISDLHFYSSQGGGVTPVKASFYTVTPCRLVDTRTGSPIGANSARTIAVAGAAGCGVPVDATAVAVNMTVVGAGDVGDLRLYPRGQTPPLASAINFSAGQTRANNAVLSLGTGGQIDVLCDMPPASTAATHFLLDVTGYFR